jgi:hypothetical protein
MSNDETSCPSLIYYSYSTRLHRPYSYIYVRIVIGSTYPSSVISSAHFYLYLYFYTYPDTKPHPYPYTITHHIYFLSNPLIYDITESCQGVFLSCS